MTDGRRSRMSWLDVPGLVLFALLALVVVLQFFTRYVLNDSLAWTEEIARYLLIGVAYAGSLSALRKNGHIFLELSYRLAPPANAKPLAFMADLASVIFHGLLTVFAVQLALASERRMISVDYPKSMVYAFVAGTLLAATVLAIKRWYARLRQDQARILADIQANAGDAT